MLPTTVSPLSTAVQDANEGPAISSEVPAFSEEARAGAAEAAASSPEGSTPEEDLGDEGAENLPCQADSCRVRPKEVLLDEEEANCECPTPHSLEP